MKKKNKLLRNEKGSISMFIIISVLFLTFVLIGIYASYANKLKSQDEQLGQLQNNYGEHVSDNGMNNLYNDLTRPPEDNSGNNSLLPAEYQQVEYIESTGTQYIDTEYIPNNNSEIMVNYASTKKDTLYNVIVSADTSYNGYTILIEGEENYVKFRSFSTTLTNTEKSISNNEVHKYKLKQGCLEIDGELYEGANNFSGNLPCLRLFARHSGGGTGFAYGRMYLLKVYENSDLKINLVPCYRKSDNVIGMYDIVNDVFYTNQGTGTFEKGEDVQTENDNNNDDNNVLPAEYQQVEYIESTGTQYIDTGCNPSSNLGVYCKFIETKIQGSGGLFGSFGSGLDKYYGFSQINNAFETFYGNQSNSISRTECLVNTEYEVYMNYLNDKKLLLNDTSICDSLGTITESNYSIWLFAINYGSTSYNYYWSQNTRIYRCKITENSLLVRDFIPCYRKSDNVIGMYDIVNDVFYTNQGTGTFEKGEDVQTENDNNNNDILFAEYQQVEYIESTGTQYIDTLIKLNQDSKVEMEFEITEAGDYNVFGSRSSASENNIGIIFSNTYKEIDIDFQNYTANRLTTTYDINKKIYKISNESLQAGESVRAVTNYSNFTTPDNAYIFSMSGNAPTYGNAKMKLYYCKIWDGETLIRNFIPCYRKSDNVIGLYDKVNNVFYTNQGTGTFRKGEDVYTEGEDDNNSLIPAAYQQVEYIKSTGTQYIDTGVIPSDEVGCYIDFKPLSAGTIFGAITQSSVGYYGINLYTAKQFEVYWERAVGKYGSFDYETKYEIEFNYMNSKNFKVDGNQLSALSATDNITTNSIHIFKLNGGTTQYTQYISAKLYRAKISNGENLIRDLVPCYRKSDNVIGMYDIVNGVFYTNQGTGTFEKGEELTELKYLSASGNQYIDTGVQATKNIKMEVVAKQNSLSTDSATGRSGMVLAGNKGWYCFGNYGTGNLVVYFCQTTREGVTIPIDTEWHTYYISNGLQKIDDKSSSISVTSEFPTLLNIWLFNLLNNYNISNIADQSIKSAKIWDGDTLIRDYIPVLDKTGVPCLYDKVEEKYYYNQGDGNFLYE